MLFLGERVEFAWRRLSIVLAFFFHFYIRQESVRGAIHRATDEQLPRPASALVRRSDQNEEVKYLLKTLLQPSKY